MYNKQIKRIYTVLIQNINMYMYKKKTTDSTADNRLYLKCRIHTKYGWSPVKQLVDLLVSTRMRYTYF